MEIIKKVPYIHCARGPERCEKCKMISKKKPDFCLIRIYLKSSNVARPMISINLNEERALYEYDVLKRFKNEQEAKTYAVKNKIELYFD